MTIQNELKVTAVPRQSRRPRFKASKSRPRARLIYPPASTSLSVHQDTHNLTETKTSTRTSDVCETVELRRPRLSLYLSLCNTALGMVGFVSAICFGVMTIVQADTANKEARVANKIARESLLLSWVQTCAQVMDISVSPLNFEAADLRS
jgi:hypothetical protein